MNEVTQIFLSFILFSLKKINTCFHSFTPHCIVQIQQANIVVFNLKFSHVLTNNLEENFSLLRTTTNNHQVLSSSSSSLFSPFIFTCKIKTNFLLFFGAFVLVHFCLALRNLVQYLIKYIDHVCFNFCRAYNSTRNINNITSQSVYFNCLL